MHSDGVVALRPRLRITGDLKWPMATTRSEFDMHLAEAETLFDESLEHAVQIAQQRHGLLVDGVVGPQTRVALNVSVQERIRQLALNMERWRQNFRERGERYVLVNIPGYSLDVVNKGQSEIRMRVVVGKPSWRTPSFQSTITQVVVNPYWSVPSGITKKEILPQVRKNPMYLRDQNMEVLDGWGATARTVDPTQIDWDHLTSSRFPYRFRQRPGPQNALGRVKFNFPNIHNVYLHDTPAHRLFAKPKRAFSHGCIRVENPLELALYLLQDNPTWTLEHLQKTIQGGTQRYVNLPTPIDVHIVYQTAWVDDNDIIQFRHDIYSYDNL
jgi:murein L,D-transpeptidase YcbB/YkuD